MGIYHGLFIFLLLLQCVKCVIWKGRPPGFPLPTHNSHGEMMTVGCGGSVGVRAGITYIFTSPGYPTSYPPFTSCSWNFYSVGGIGNINLNCPVFDLEGTEPNCNTGSFLALQTPQTQQNMWYCGNKGPQGISTSTTLSVYFWSGWNGGMNKRGLYCTINIGTAHQSTTPTVQPPTPSPSICRCGRRGFNTRIVGGSDALLHEFPWMVLIILPNGICGGTLINDRFVLTAAHCIDSRVLPNNALPSIVLGEHRRSVQDETSSTIILQALRVWPNENYKPGESKNNDIGLVELASIVDLDRVYPNIAPACPPSGSSPLVSDGGLEVTTLGWGFTSVPGNRSDVLQKVDMTTESITECKNKYEDGIVTDNMICAAATNRDSCFDDSGGPLLTKVGDSWEVIGVVSFGPTVCADNTIPGVYTKVANYLSWIRSKVGNARTCRPVS